MVKLKIGGLDGLGKALVKSNIGMFEDEFRKRYDGSSQNYVVLKDAVFQLGTSTPELG